MDGRDLTSNECAVPHSEPTTSAGDRTAEDALGSWSPAGGGDQTEEKAPGAPPPSGAVGESCDALARAISSTLGAVTREFDLRASGAARSQDDLALSLDRLTGELDKLLEDAPLLIIMQHAAKITSIRKRVSSLNLLLKSIQRRIDNIDCMISTGVPTGKIQGDIVETSQLTL